MYTSLKRLWIILMVFSMLLAGCQSNSTPIASATPQPGAILTAAAQTASARLTELSLPSSTPTNTPTGTPVPPFPTVEGTVLPTLNLSASPTFPILTPLVTVPQGGGDQATYVGETIPDNTDFAPGAAFTKSWTFKNSGSTTWTTSYAMAFISGEKMGGPDAVSLTKNVAPGEMIEIPVNLTAPLNSGTYNGVWELRNATGGLFQPAVWVRIDVIGGTPGVPPTQPTGGKITKVNLSVDKANASSCPHTFNFVASFTVTADTTISYQFEAGTTTPGFKFNLPAKVTTTLGPGDYTIPLTLDITSAVVGWVQFHILTPTDVLSAKVNFTLTCK